MEERPTTIRVYPGELKSVYYTSVLASKSTNAVEVRKYIYILRGLSSTYMYIVSLVAEECRIDV